MRPYRAPPKARHVELGCNCVLAVAKTKNVPAAVYNSKDWRSTRKFR
jgi:hypothetical protein